MDKTLEKFLKQSKTKFKTLTHKVVYTAHDEAQTQKKKLQELAKTVLLKVDQGWAIVVVPASKYVDFKAVGKTLKAKKVMMAKEADMARYLKTKIGLLHPFGNLYKIPTLLDKAVAKSKKLIASAGSYTESIEVALKDFEKLTTPIKGIFSKTKK
jgi:Ala-tRNA(Pro) deacylase